MLTLSLLRTASAFLTFRSPYLQREKGQGLVEYAVILVLVAIVVITALEVLGPQIGNIYSTISNSLPGD